MKRLEPGDRELAVITGDLLSYMKEEPGRELFRGWELGWLEAGRCMFEKRARADMDDGAPGGNGVNRILHHPHVAARILPLYCSREGAMTRAHRPGDLSRFIAASVAEDWP